MLDAMRTSPHAALVQYPGSETWQLIHRSRLCDSRLYATQPPIDPLRIPIAIEVVARDSLRTHWINAVATVRLTAEMQAVMVA